MGRGFSKPSFSKPKGCNIQEILKVTSLFPRLINEEMKKSLKEEVLEEGLEKIVYSFQKGKSPGPDGFTIEFFQGFFELVKGYFLKVVKESQRAGKVLGALNSTFLALIPKKRNSSSFEDFRPISCCNVVYKIIANILAQRLNPTLS